MVPVGNPIVGTTLKPLKALQAADWDARVFRFKPRHYTTHPTISTSVWVWVLMLPENPPEGSRKPLANLSALGAANTPK